MQSRAVSCPALSRAAGWRGKETIGVAAERSQGALTRVIGVGVGIRHFAEDGPGMQEVMCSLSRKRSEVAWELELEEAPREWCRF